MIKKNNKLWLFLLFFLILITGTVFLSCRKTKEFEKNRAKIMFEDNLTFELPSEMILRTKKILDSGIEAIAGGLEKVIPKTVGQATGLKDKNGRGDEIYAGSLIWRVDEMDTYAVVWRKVHGQWWLREYRQGLLRGWAVPLMKAAASEYLTLCGNIHTEAE